MKLPPVQRVKITAIRMPGRIGQGFDVYEYEFAVKLDRGDPFRVVDARVVVRVGDWLNLRSPQSLAVVAMYIRYRVADPEFDIPQGSPWILQVPDDDHAFMLAIDPDRAAGALDTWIPISPSLASD